MTATIAPNNPIIINEENAPRSLPFLIPVSYTHLDVYKRQGKNILAFCNAADTLYRDNLTLRISLNNGCDWSIAIPVDKSTNPERGDYTAYADIVKLTNHEIGVLYERNNYSEIVFTIKKWSPNDVK